ncbi:MAG: M48 family metalloprotease [Pseudohongiellaceae bacterium]
MPVLRSLGRLTVLSAALAFAGPATAQVELPSLGDRMSGVFSSQEEHRMGREFLRSVRRSAPTINDPLISDYVVRFTYELARHSELQDRDLAFAIIDSPALNAFAAPGGVIGVNGGLFLNAETEGEFASVMAHELAHVSQRHFARGVEDAQRRRLPELATLLASIVVMAGTAGSDSNAGAAAVMAAQGRAIENQLRFSRQNEQEADRVGLRTLYEAGYNPNDMPSLFERLQSMSRFSTRPPEFLLSHPVTESRIADTRSRATRYARQDGKDSLDYHLIRARIQVRYAEDSASAVTEFRRRLQEAGEDGRREALRYGLAVALAADEQYPEALDIMEELLDDNRNRIAYVTTRAEMLINMGEPNQAIQFLERHLEINPANHPLVMTYADALIDARLYPQAARVLEKHTSRRPDDHHLWYTIAEIQGLAGDISKVHQARAEYFTLVGDFRSAREQLTYALRIETGRDSNEPLLARLRQRMMEVERMQREASNGGQPRR